MADLRHIDTWIFDLDNTLYEAECQLFAQIDVRMTAFVAAKLEKPHHEARKIQKDYYVEYGTTLNGLIKNHSICPEEFLSFVHDIDLAPIKKCPHLAAAIESLPGRRLIFTNGSTEHAENVCNARGITHLFEDIFDIRAANFTPKPQEGAYATFLELHGVTPTKSAMFEDMSQNLVTPHALGVTTILIQSSADWLTDEPLEKRPAKAGETGDHVDFVTENLTAFLENAITAATSSK